MTSASGLAGLRYSVVGAGRVGASLAHWLTASGARLQFVASRSAGAAAALARACGGSAAEPARISTQGCDLLLIAVPDVVIPAVASDLAGRPQAAVALHASGSQTAGILAPLRAAGAAIGSLHPLMAFPKVRPDVGDARELVFGIDGDDAAITLCRRLASAWDARTVTIPAEARLLYHFAATLAAGGVLTLAALAEEIARRLHLPAELGAGYRHLAVTALQAAGHGGAADAITGPTARGDEALVTAELAAAEELLPHAAPLVTALAIETLRQVGDGRTLTSSQQHLLEQLLARLRG